MSFKGKRILIIGIARSGLAAAEALHRRGAHLGAYDAKKRTKIPKEIGQLERLGILVYAGEYPPLTERDWDLIVVSPGVPADAEIVSRAKQAGIPIIGELELAYRLKSNDVAIYAITGTNGKTTTTALLHFILAQDGRAAAAGGNIGTALCSLVDDLPSGELVVEVSSFQLETVETFKPDIAGILNITPDHLDRHKSMDEYARVKSRVFSLQNSDDYLILNYEDEIVRTFSLSARARVVFFSTDRELADGFFIDKGSIFFAQNGTRRLISTLAGVRLRGKHNLENILCAVAMAWSAGVGEETIGRSLRSFTGVRHRLEQVACHKGVLYINDSKGTNPDSTIKALEAFTEPIVLIAGGRAKGGDYSGVAKLMASRIKALVLLGEAKEMIKTAVMEQGFKNIYEVDDLVAAVKKASELAFPGDVVLLSPACASWDMFSSYEHRGDLFCQEVAQLIEGDIGA
ncbi:MAG: UDP-N-acetylmuramoyl-L-alanine--D-glutamate ligase [Syntrophomonadaceae bacterium]